MLTGPPLPTLPGSRPFLGFVKGIIPMSGGSVGRMTSRDCEESVHADGGLSKNVLGGAAAALGRYNQPSKWEVLDLEVGNAKCSGIKGLRGAKWPLDFARSYSGRGVTRSGYRVYGCLKKAGDKMSFLAPSSVSSGPWEPRGDVPGGGPRSS
jgi:hypothetical protein